MNWENLPSTNTPLNATNLQKITDSGSNANGNYVKFQDGTMVQWNDLEVDDQAIDGSYGSLYQGTRDIALPQAFKNTHYVALCTQFLWGTGASWGSVVQRNTNSAFTIRGYDYFSRPTGTRTYISWIAIGKWK